MPANVSRFIIPTSAGNEVFACGTAFGELPHRANDDYDYQHEPKKSPIPFNVVSISLASEYAMAVGDGGRLWAWGLGGRTRCALFNSLPKVIPHRRSFDSVSSGFAHTLALDTEGCVWSLGDNGCGQLGLHDYDRRTEFVMIEGIPYIQTVAAGGEFSLLLDVCGNIWSFGAGGDGQLGHVDCACTSVPSKIAGYYGSDFGVTFIHISCGFKHALALDIHWKAWSFGSNSHGQLGFETELPLYKCPARIHTLGPVRQILCGGESSYTQDNEGRVMVFGSNRLCQLGLVYGPMVCHKPVENPLFKDSRLIGGGHHVLSVDPRGDVRFYGSLTSISGNDPNKDPLIATELGINIGTVDKLPEEPDTIEPVQVTSTGTIEPVQITSTCDTDNSSCNGEQEGDITLPQCGKRLREDAQSAPEPQPKRKAPSILSTWLSALANYVSPARKCDLP